MARSISHLTFTLCECKFWNALTAREVLSGRQHLYFSDDKRKLFNLAVEHYQRFTDKLWIVEGNGKVGVEHIRNYVENIISITGIPPFILIDYLQILSQFDPKARLTDKQCVDRNVTELKLISRDFRVPILVISSFNRENYNSSVSMQSFKESGAIEYSADVLIGLQLTPLLLCTFYLTPLLHTIPDLPAWVSPKSYVFVWCFLCIFYILMTLPALSLTSFLSD